jgi:hypothetical protein
MAVRYSQYLDELETKEELGRDWRQQIKKTRYALAGDEVVGCGSEKDGIGKARLRLVEGGTPPRKCRPFIFRKTHLRLPNLDPLPFCLLFAPGK